MNRVDAGLVSVVWVLLLFVAVFVAVLNVPEASTPSRYRVETRAGSQFSFLLAGIQFNSNGGSGSGSSPPQTWDRWLMFTFTAHYGSTIGDELTNHWWNGSTGVFDFNADNEPDFNDVIGYLTNGENDYVELSIYLSAEGGAGVGDDEKSWGIGDPDLAGFSIDFIRLVVDSLSVSWIGGYEDIQILINYNCTWEIWGTPAKPLAQAIYIRPDGSVEPSTAPIQRDGNIYTLTDQVDESIVVERDNVVFDGAGHSVQGAGSETGIVLAGRSNVTVRNTEIMAFHQGILLHRSFGNSIYSNNVTANNYEGIRVHYSSNNSIFNNNIAANKHYGVGLWVSCRNNSIYRNRIEGSSHGILLWSSSDNIINGSNIENSYYGIFLDDSSDNVLSGNDLTDNDHGMLLSCSSDNILSGNSIAAGNYGILIEDSSNNTLTGNSIVNTKFSFGVEGSERSDYAHSISTSNTVDGKPIYFLQDRHGLIVDPSTFPDIGYLALVNSTDVDIEGLELRNNFQGILLAYTTVSRITNSIIAHNHYGIRLSCSENNSIFENIMSNNHYGIGIRGSSRNTLSGNKITANVNYGIILENSLNHSIYGNNIPNNTYHGVGLANSSHNAISGNTITNQSCGVFLSDSSSSNEIYGNDVTDNSWYALLLKSSNSNAIFDNSIGTHTYSGIYLDSASNNVVSGNTITNNSGWGGILVYGSYNVILENNITSNRDYGICLCGPNNVVSGNNITKNQLGVMLFYSLNNVSGNNITSSSFAGVYVECSDNIIHGNTIAKNYYGIRFSYAVSYTTISDNNITDNYCGIYFYTSSSYNKIYHNNIVNNTQQAYTPVALTNTWDDDYPSGGNHWSDYTGADIKSGPNQDHPGSDSIGDTSYLIDVYNQDRYPLTKPWPSGPGLHELEVTLEAAALVRPASSTLLRTAVKNNGLNNEENVTLLLFINNTVVNSTTISMLEVGSSYTIDYVWTAPIVECQVNVTACATPVLGEIYFANNKKTRLINVTVPQVHNVNTDLDYLTIQQAIDASETLHGHTIKVDAGTYHEHVVVNKAISLIGENMSNTVIDGNRTGTVIYVTTNNVIIRNFTIRNSGIYSPYSGIHLRSVQNCRITNNTVIDDWAGIWLEYSSNNFIYHNNFINNTAAQAVVSPGYVNKWDDGYRSGGNYWSSYIGVDEKSGPDQDQLGSDGIGDTLYFFCANSWDRFPLMHPWPTEPSLHELQATLKAPMRLPLGSSTPLEATVWNYGFSNEQDIKFYLLVNGTVVNSTTISLMESSCSYTINYLWTPNVEGRVNITAYAIPVSSEIYVANNRKTSFATVSSKPPIQNVDTALYYDTIQEAIDATETLDGHTIIVEAGTYYEHVTIRKSLRILGEDRAYTIIDGSKTGIFVVRIDANYVVLSGFTIQNSDVAPTPAVRIYSSHNVISNNTIINNGWGIYAFSVSNNTISNNVIANNVYGIDLEWVTSHTIKDNIISNHQQAGIYLGDSRNSVFTNNIIRNNKEGIVLVSDSNKNKFYHNNFIDNTSQGFTVNSDTNAWDNGYPSGGNYWSNYAGVDVKSGPNQNQPGSDGIGDTPQTFSGDNQDRYPLMNPMGSPQPPIALFTLTPENPPKGETATFDASTSHDRDGSITSYKWNFGDGNIITVTTAIMTHIYSSSGTYTVNLTITDNDGLSHSTTKPVTVPVDSAPPTTVHNYDGLWHTADFTITLTATDPGSGVAETYYKINNEPTKTVSANGQPHIATQGNNNKLEYWSTDRVGNEELPHKILTGIRLDELAPEGSVTINNLNTYTTSTSVTLTLTLIDNTSGVDKVRYSNDGTWDTEPWETPISAKAWILTSGDGTKTVYYQIKDGAGLVSTTYSDTIILDTVPPTTTDDFDGQWHLTEFTITLTVSDDPNGIAETYYRINDLPTSYVSINGQPLITGNGANNTLEYWSIDNAGNEELPHKFLTGIKLDTMPPTGDMLINNGQTYTTTAKIILNFVAVDMFSGVSQIRFSNDDLWDTEPWETPSTVLFPQAQKNWTLTSGDGNKTVYFQIKDNAGHVSKTYSDTIILDTTKPTANAGADKTINEDTLVTLNASTSWDQNGIIEYTWTFWDGYSQQLVMSVDHVHNFTNPGTYTVNLQVTDAAGHSATDTVIITVLDTTKPVAKAGQNQTVDKGATVTFDAGASTDNAGVVSYEWSFGDGVTGTGRTTSHTYATAGTYTVTLTVKDAADNTASDSLTVTVRSDGQPLPSAEAFPMWAISAAILALGIALATIVFLKKRRS